MSSDVAGNKEIIIHGEMEYRSVEYSDAIRKILTCSKSGNAFLSIFSRNCDPK